MTPDPSSSLPASTLLDTRGFACIGQAITHSECDSIADRITSLVQSSAGTRNILSEPWCRSLVQTLRGHDVLSTLVPGDFAAVLCTYFEKSADRNWLVPVHQDLSIPVAERFENPHLSGWSQKEGSWFVQPPEQLLAELVAVRLHLDQCGPNDGPLKVVPGSHVLGRVNPETAPSIREAMSEISCEVEKGEALVMRPLLLHSSSKSTGQSRRRVLHFLFGPRELPYGLLWQRAI